jgi:hypothetical protein
MAASTACPSSRTSGNSACTPRSLETLRRRRRRPQPRLLQITHQTGGKVRRARPLGAARQLQPWLHSRLESRHPPVPLAAVSPRPRPRPGVPPALCHGARQHHINTSTLAHPLAPTLAVQGPNAPRWLACVRWKRAAPRVGDASLVEQAAREQAVADQQPPEVQLLRLRPTGKRLPVSAQVLQRPGTRVG